MPDGTLRTETWPRPFLEVPLSLVRDDDINSEFIVFVDGQPACGKWVTFQFDRPDAYAESAERAFCFWRWGDPPLLPSQEPSVVRWSIMAPNTRASEDLQPNWYGMHTLHVNSRRLGRLLLRSAAECRFELLRPTTDSLWPAVWGDYIVWVLLSQVQDGATWEEVRFAREAIAMWTSVNLNASYYQIRKLERHGFLVMRGHRYRDFRSRIALANLPGRTLRGEYCGLTSALYELVRKVQPARLIVVPSQPSRPAKLLIDWPQHERDSVRAACQQLDIQAVQRLW